MLVAVRVYFWDAKINSHKGTRDLQPPFVIVVGRKRWPTSVLYQALTDRGPGRAPGSVWPSLRSHSAPQTLTPSSRSVLLCPKQLGASTAPVFIFFFPLKWMQCVFKSPPDPEKIGTATALLQCYDCTVSQTWRRDLSCAFLAIMWPIKFSTDFTV